MGLVVNLEMLKELIRKYGNIKIVDLLKEGGR